MFTVRSDNWNEKLGVVSSSDVALVQGNQTNSGELSPITLKTFLKNSKQYGGYTGMKTEDLSDDVLDQKCSIRFQTTFLPVSAATSKGAIEFSTEAYNYNTRSDSDPRNLVLLCTTQGIALQQDGQGDFRLNLIALALKGKKVSFNAIMLQLSSMIALLWLASFAADFLMLFVLPERKHYRTYKLERTPDFSDLRNKIAEVEGEKKKLRERKNRFAAKLDDA